MLRTLMSALSLQRFLADRRGNVMIMFAGMGVGLVLMVGAGVDYTRAMQFKSSLQALADASVLAGASVYVSSSPDTSSNGIAMAQQYWQNGLSRLPANNLVGTPVFTTSFDATGYSVHVSVPTSTIKTTFLSLVTNTIGVAVTATAKDPIVTATINLNGWTSDAGDGNSIYWYKVPQNDSIPAFTQANIDNGTFNLIFSNVVTTPATLSSSIAAAQQIAFAFVNQTAGHSPGWNYCNQYGGCTGSTHIFYSQLTDPNGASATDAPNGYGYPTTSGYAGGVVKNCSLQVQSYTSSDTAPTNPPSTGSCLTPAATLNPLFSPSCSSLAGKSVHYSWNDMGGGSDDTDYNDGQYNFNCSGAGATTGVILTD
jgi:Flp pilus assembly protein TadG